MNEREPQTLVEAVRYFADGRACAEYMRTIKWPDGVVRCPKCDSCRAAVRKTETGEEAEKVMSRNAICFQTALGEPSI